MTTNRSVEGLNVLVTGSNRGLGVGFVESMIDRGAAKVYCAARDPASVAHLVDRFGARAVPVTLDVTNADQIKAAGEALQDLDILVSNAGVTYITPLLQTNLEEARRVMEINYFGPLQMIYAFADTLIRRQGGFIYVLSLAGLLPAKTAELYSASKAAGMMLGYAASTSLPGVDVSLVYPGYIDTDMGAVFDRVKAQPRRIADRSIDAWARGDLSVFTDRHSELVRDGVVEKSAEVLRDPYKVMAEAGAAYVAETTG